MKQLIVLFLTLTFISCKEEKPNFANLVDESIRLNTLENPIIVHKTANNAFVGNSKNIKFLTSKELLIKKDEKFYSLLIRNFKDSIGIYLSHYKSGKDFVTIFDKENHYKVLYNDYIQTKRGESVPYDIYLNIVKDKYPEGLVKKFKKEQDSLKLIRNR